LFTKASEHTLLYRQLAVCLVCAFITVKNSAQDQKTPTVAWLLPGISYQDSSSLKLLLQYGVNSRQQINAVYLQAFVKAGKHIIINPGYLFLHFAGASPSIHEHGIMNAIVLSFHIGKINIDDRNLFWHRLRTRGDDFHLYRNRLRVSGPVFLPSFPARLYLFDEVFYHFNQHRWTRNRLAIGCSIDIRHWLNTDFFYAREYDVFNGNTNLVFIMTTLQLRRSKKIRAL
jgi:ABC-type transporter Mla MlaB component